MKLDSASEVALVARLTLNVLCQKVIVNVGVDEYIGMSLLYGVEQSFYGCMNL